ncbi:hypothetical protein ACFSO0_06220 [Brevibacillus sp. GCM10020057]|uniref:hypothetical protein n=1 Tax=Brevibacillus sp. GCM10020057 TaxID=3317327 RepID=UPI00362F2103
MSTQSAGQGKPRPVVVWESRPERQGGNVVARPSRIGRPGVVEQEASVKKWTVGPADSLVVSTKGSETDKQLSCVQQSTSG